MAAKKREIYARAAVQLRTHQRAFRAEALCPGAMGLYLFLLLDSRGEQTSGDVASVVADASWGGKEGYRRKQADALVEVGLVERVGDVLHVVKYEEHNDTPADIESAREAARQRKASQRGHGVVTRDTGVRHAEVPISISSSLSGSDLDPRSDPPAKSGGPPLPEREAWFDDAINTVEFETNETLPRGDAWLRYSGHRAGKSIQPTTRDAVYWLTTVMVPEARKRREEATRQRERDAKFDRERSRRGGPAEPGKLTVDEQRELEAAVPMVRRTKGAA